MRVITSYGIGEVNDIEWKGGTSFVNVKLKTPFLDQHQMEMNRANVFVISDWALVRVINVAARGLFSNMQFYPSEESAEGAFLAPVPPDEMVFLLNLGQGRFKLNGGHDVLYDRSVIISPWVDRWAVEDIQLFETASEASKTFEDTDMSGTTGGIASFIQLDGRWGGTIRGFYLSVPGGIII